MEDIQEKFAVKAYHFDPILSIGSFYAIHERRPPLY